MGTVSDLPDRGDGSAEGDFKNSDIQSTSFRDCCRLCKFACAINRVENNVFLIRHEVIPGKCLSS